MTDRPTRTDPPDYPERKKNLAKMPTGEISLDDIRHELKERRAQRKVKLVLQIIGALTPLVIAGFGVWKAFAAHGQANAATATEGSHQLLMEYKLDEEKRAREDIEAELEKLRDKFDKLQLKQVSCCARRDDHEHR